MTACGRWFENRILICLVPAGGIDQIGQCHKDTDAINQSDAQKRQLYMNRIDETGGQGTDHTAKGFCGIVKAHNQIFLYRICPLRHHVLQHRQADRITCVYHDAAKNVDGNFRNQQRADSRGGAEHGCIHRGLPDIGFPDDPKAQGHIGNKGNQTDSGLDNAVVGGSHTQLILQVVIKNLVKAGISKIRQDIHSEEQRKGLAHKMPAVKQGLQGVGLI